MLGVPFGPKKYTLAVLGDVEAEVHRNAALQFKFPWFDEQVLVEERLAARIRLTAEDKLSIDVAAGVLRDAVLADPLRYMQGSGSPPSPVDCRVLAHGHVRDCIVTTDDLGMHLLAAEFGIRVWHGFEPLKALLNAKAITTPMVKEIYDALEANGDLPATWRKARHVKFSRVFGRSP